MRKTNGRYKCKRCKTKIEGNLGQEIETERRIEKGIVETERIGTAKIGKEKKTGKEAEQEVEIKRREEDRLHRLKKDMVVVKNILQEKTIINQIKIVGIIITNHILKASKNLHLKGLQFLKTTVKLITPMTILG